MSRYWQTLVDNLAFLVFFTPLVGSLLVAASSRLGRDAIRRTALTNVLLTLALTLLMVAKFDANRSAASSTAGHYQMTTSWRWLQRETFHLEQREAAEQGAADTEVLVADHAGPNVRLAMGVDGISLWFIVLTAAVMVPATCAGASSDREHPALYYCLLLILQSALIGVFVTVDVVFFLICVELVSLLFVCLIARWGGQQRLAVVKRLFGFSLAATLLITVGLLTLVVSHTRMRIDENGLYPAPTFAFEELIQGGNVDGLGARVAGVGQLIYDNEMARQFWSAVGAWIFLPLMIGFAMQAALVPAHSRPVAANAPALPSVSVLLMGVSLACGFYGMGRFIVPLFPPYSLGAIPWISDLAVMGALYVGFLAITQSDIKRTAMLTCVGQASLATAGLFSFTDSGVVGGLLLMVGTGLSVAAVLFVLGIVVDRADSGDGDSVLDLRERPRAAVCLIASVLALVATPGFGPFAGLLLTLRGLFTAGPNADGSPLIVAGGLLASVCFAWGFVRCLQSHRLSAAVTTSSDDARRSLVAARPLLSGAARDLAWSEVAAVAVCLGMSAGIGLCPGYLATRVGRWSYGVHAVDNTGQLHRGIGFHTRSHAMVAGREED